LPFFINRKPAFALHFSRYFPRLGLTLHRSAGVVFTDTMHTLPFLFVSAKLFSFLFNLFFLFPHVMTAPIGKVTCVFSFFFPAFPALSGSC